MALGIHCNPFATYYFGDNIYIFRKAEREEKELCVEITSYFSFDKTIARIAKSTLDFSDSENPWEYSSSCYLRIQELLKDGRIPQLIGGEVKFSLPFSTASTSTSCTSSGNSSSSSPTQSELSPSTNLQQIDIRDKAFTYCKQAIDCIKLEIAEGGNHSEDLICPITQVLFLDPVIDTCGHTFENSAITAHLAESKLCPISRREITEVPAKNLAILGLVDKIRNSSPVPILPPRSVATGDYQKTKESYLKAAETLDQAGVYDSAIDMISRAVVIDGSRESYQLLAIYYEKLQQPLKRALVYLHLAEGSFLDAKDDPTSGALGEAREYLSKALHIAMPLQTIEKQLLPNIQIAYDFCQLALGNYQETLPRLRALIETIHDEVKLETILKLLIASDPKNPALYDALSNGSLSGGISLLGYLHLKGVNPEAAKRFYQLAKNGIKTESSVGFLPYIAKIASPQFEGTKSSMQTGKQARVYRKLGAIFDQNNDPRAAHYFFEKASQSFEETEMRLYIDFLLRKQDRSIVKKTYLDWINFESFVSIKKAREITLEAIEKLGRETIFLEKLFELYQAHIESIDVDRSENEISFGYYFSESGDSFNEQELREIIKDLSKIYKAIIDSNSSNPNSAKDITLSTSSSSSSSSPIGQFGDISSPGEAKPTPSGAVCSSSLTSQENAVFGSEFDETGFEHDLENYDNPFEDPIDDFSTESNPFIVNRNEEWVKLEKIYSFARKNVLLIGNKFFEDEYEYASIVSKIDSNRGMKLFYKLALSRFRSFNSIDEIAVEITKCVDAINELALSQSLFGTPILPLSIDTISFKMISSIASLSQRVKLLESQLKKDSIKTKTSQQVPEAFIDKFEAEIQKVWKAIDSQCSLISTHTSAIHLLLSREEGSFQSVLPDQRTTASSASSVPLSSSSSSSSSSMRSSVSLLHSPIVFGPEDWNHYFGDVGEIPPLPADIEKFLIEESVFWEGESISDTHFLTLIPATINGHPFCLNLLSKLIKTPSKKGGYPTQFHYYDDSTLKLAIGNQSVERSYWVLTTNKLLPDYEYKDPTQTLTRGKPKVPVTFHIITNQNRRLPSNRQYRIPSPLEAMTSMTMHYIKNGKMSFKQNYFLCELNLKYIWEYHKDKNKEFKAPYEEVLELVPDEIRWGKSKSDSRLRSIPEKRSPDQIWKKNKKYMYAGNFSLEGIDTSLRIPDLCQTRHRFLGSIKSATSFIGIMGAMEI